MRARKRKTLQTRRDDVRVKLDQLPEGTSLEEQSCKSWKAWREEVVSKIDTEALAKGWNIWIKCAQMTIEATAQKGIRTVRNLLNKHLLTQSYILKRTAPGTWYTDAFHARDPSIRRQGKATQVFSNGKRYVEFIPTLMKSWCHDGLSICINEVGIPKHLVFDGALEEEGGYGSYKTKRNELQTKYQFPQTFIQPHVSRQTTAELDIRHLRQDIGISTALKWSPRKLWTYYRMYYASIKQPMASMDP